MQTTNPVHKKQREDAMCGSPSRLLADHTRYVTCEDCQRIIESRGRLPTRQRIQKNAYNGIVKQKMVDAEKLIESYIVPSSEKMNIETGNFYKNLCLGFDVPSLGFNILPTKLTQ